LSNEGRLKMEDGRWKMEDGKMGRLKIYILK
jgi:hypothetical protein